MHYEGKEFLNLYIYKYKRAHSVLNLNVLSIKYVFLHMECARLYLFVVYVLFAPVISTIIHRCVNNSPDIKLLMKVIEPETFNVDFTSQ